jgi:hypothetical protein
LENWATNEAIAVGKHRKSALRMAAVASLMNDEFPKETPKNPTSPPVESENPPLVMDYQTPKTRRILSF